MSELNNSDLTMDCLINFPAKKCFIQGYAGMQYFFLSNKAVR